MISIVIQCDTWHIHGYDKSPEGLFDSLTFSIYIYMYIYVYIYISWWTSRFNRRVQQPSWWPPKKFLQHLIIFPMRIEFGDFPGDIYQFPEGIYNISIVCLCSFTLHLDINHFNHFNQISTISTISTISRIILQKTRHISMVFLFFFPSFFHPFFGDFAIPTVIFPCLRWRKRRPPRQRRT